ncbi:class I SAM-dependent methyltransferase [Spiroplasma endosymbiont of Anurida maritima]|uniref:class I SAM-dependent methyltransferase n=1 Tax=Spiroplasma endosymbiont of Anurida maritima TaxID=2967972 RepID=UPI0036D3F4CD
MIINISQRLRTIVDLVQKSNIICDIGTDHGLVPIFLVQNKIVKKAYACDINEKPLKTAQKNIDEAKLTSYIKTIKSDGLQSLPDENFDYAIIAGLGTPLILDILKHDKNNISKYIICSNTNVADIRMWAKVNNYQILTEKIIYENDKYYECLVINKQLKNINNSKLDLLMGKSHSQKDFNFEIYSKLWNKRLLKNKKLIEILKKKDYKRYKNLKKINKQISKRLKYVSEKFL